MTSLLDSPAAVRRAAMDLLARREHGRAELARKLGRCGASAELIEAALDRLAEEGLLNESRYLDAFVVSRARAGYGPLRIREELARRGLPRQAIERARQGRFLGYRGFPPEMIGRLLRGDVSDDC